MVSSPSGVRKRVLVYFELEKNDSGDDEFDIFIICLSSLGPQPPSGCAPSSVPLPQLSPSLMSFPIPLSLPALTP